MVAESSEHRGGVNRGGLDPIPWAIELRRLPHQAVSGHVRVEAERKVGSSDIETNVVIVDDTGPSASGWREHAAWRGPTTQSP